MNRFALFLALAGGLALAAAIPSADAASFALPSAASLKSHRSIKARKLKQAYESLEDEEFDAALAQAAPLAQDPIYADYGLGISAAALRGQAAADYQARKYDAAASKAARSIAQELEISANYPYSPFWHTVSRDIASAELLRADAAWAQKHWKQAIFWGGRAFTRLSDHGNLALVEPESVKHYAESCSKAKKADFCKQWVLRFFLNSQHGNGHSANSQEFHALLKIFPDLEASGRPPHFARATSPYHAPDLDTAALETVMEAYSKGGFAAASEGFQKFLDDYPKSGYRYRVRYLLADSLERRGKKDEARKAFEQLSQDSPLSFYGLMASFALNQPFDRFISPEAPEVSDHDAFASPNELFKLGRAQAFLAEGSDELAALELKDIRPHDGLSNPFLLYLVSLGAQARNFNYSFQVLSELAQRSSPDVATQAMLPVIFPLSRYDIVQRYSEQTQLDPILVLSLIKQESSFDEKIYSSVGAVGLMQLMPSTAQEILGGSAFEKDELLDAERNIEAGTKYLSKLLGRYNGNIALALAAYNAGPNAVDHWLRDSSFKDDETRFLESIPYRETREYVGSIIRNYYWYSKRLKAPQKPLSYFWAKPPGK